MQSFSIFDLQKFYKDKCDQFNKMTLKCDVYIQYILYEINWYKLRLVISIAQVSFIIYSMQHSKNRLLRRNPSSKFSEKNVKRPPSRPMVSLPKTKIITNKSVKTNDTLLRKFPSISSTNWCIYNIQSDHFVGYRQDVQRQVASLTKIMTSILALELIEQYKLDKNILIRISKSSASLNGTTANLRQGKWIKVYDLIYGAMLPSGNDAAFLLAEVFGLLLFYETVKPSDRQYSDIECIDLTCYQSTWTFVNRFIKVMNRKAKQLKMYKTNFANSHGLSNALNMSSARDMLIISKYAFMNKQFRKIANTFKFCSELYENQQGQIWDYRNWKNTNKLLNEGWQGIKTGNTVPAGGCLSSVKDGVFIIVLNSATLQSRFQQTILLYEWYQERNSCEQTQTTLT